MRNLSQGLSLKGYLTRPLQSLAQRALSAIRRNGGTLLLPGASTPIGPVNQLLWSGDFSNAAWLKQETATVGALTADPLGGTEARILNVATSLARIAQTVANTAGSTLTFAVWVRKSTTGGANAVRLSTGDGLAWSTGPSLKIALTSEWQLAVLSGVLATSGVSVALRIGAVTATAGADADCVGNVDIYRAALFQGTVTASEILAAGGIPRTGSIPDAIGYTHGNPPLRNYLDSTGTDLLDSVTQVDQPVGLCLDSMGVLGAELATQSSWAAPGIGGPAFTAQNVTPAKPIGKTYVLSATVSGYSGSGTVGFSGVDFGGSAAGSISGNGSIYAILQATATDPSALYTRSTNTATFSNISVREIPGNHASQPTTSSKPLLRRGPVNQLLWSGDFSNAAWTKTAASVAYNATTAPDGGTCFKLTEDTATALHRVEQNWTATAGATYTIAVVVKAAERKWACLFEDSGGGSAWVNLSDGALGSVANGTAASAHLGSGWHLLVLTYAQTGTILRFRLNTATANNIGSYAGDGTSGVLLHRAALFNGTVTADQILAAGGIPLTTTAPASSERGRYSWQFDGSNDFLQTGITTGNEGWVCAGVTVANHTSNQTLFGNGASDGTAKGIWVVKVGGSTTFSFYVSDGMGVREALATSAIPAGIPSVLQIGWTPTTMVTAVDTAETSRAKTKDPTHTAGIQIGGLYSIFHTGPMTVFIHTPVLPSAADRALIRRFVGSLQGQTL